VCHGSTLIRGAVDGMIRPTPWLRPVFFSLDCRSLAVLAALTLATAGCGGDDEGGPADGGETGMDAAPDPDGGATPSSP